jgi:DNA helicase-2/ATP-dependent DNA helicase PcrA
MICKIYGPPGSGKTEKLLKIIKTLNKEKNIPMKDMIYMSFTKKCVKDSKRRMLEKGYKKKDLANFKTLHAHCYGLIGMQKNQVMSRQDWKQFSQEIGYDFKGHYCESFSKGDDTYINVYNLMRSNINTYKKMRHVFNIDSVTYDCIIESYKHYKQRNIKFDFHDMLIYCFKAYNKIEDFAFNSFFKYVFLDEAQDFTSLQWYTFNSITRNIKNFFIAGDDDQAIYEWGGGDPEVFNRYPGSTFVLKKTHRLPKNILELSRAVSCQIKKRQPKKIFSEKPDGKIEFITTYHLLMLNYNQPWLFLSRVNYKLTEIAKLFIDTGILFKLKEKGSIKYKDIRQIFLYEENKENEKPWYDVFTWKQTKIDYIRKFIDRCKKDGISFVNRIKEGPYVELDTIHGAKGKECRNVLIFDFLTRNVMRNMELNQDMELRVLYVAITRAKENLYLCESDHRYKYNFLNFMV